MNGKLYLKSLEFKNKIKIPKKGDIYNLKTSIIIPVYYADYLEQVLLHLSNNSSVDEIILVDDSGEFTKNNFDFIKIYKNIKVFYHEKNLGRSAARNTGASKAKNDILIFLDQDMFLSPTFIDDALSYFHSNGSLIYLGQRETVSIDMIPEYNRWKSLNINLDWRVSTFVTPNLIDVTVSGCGDKNNNCSEKELISLYEESNKLEKLGCDPRFTIGFWDLPSMVISHSMAVAKVDFFSLGGFPEWINGWGGEDIVFGFLACAKHIPIYLSDNTSYQAEHSPYSGSLENNLIELKKNIASYRKWAKDANEFPRFDYKNIFQRGVQFKY